MRSSLLIASTLAVGAFSSPVEKRRIVTEFEVEVKTITVYVTAGAPQPTVDPTTTSAHYAWWWQPNPDSSTSSSTTAPGPPPQAQVPSAPALAPTTTTVATPTTPSQAPPSSTQAYGGGRPTGEAQANLSAGPEYKAAVLYHHNAARANHGAPPLAWDDACEAGARRTAETCVFNHPAFLVELKQGQNLFTTSGDAFNVTAAITESWYKGELAAMRPYFGSADVPENVFHSVGHLTAMLWKSTTGVGCVSINCGNKMKMGDGTPTDMNKFTVCNYSPPGNYAGRYAENVAPPVSNGNLGSWAD